MESDLDIAIANAEKRPLWAFLLAILVVTAISMPLVVPLAATILHQGKSR